MVEVIKFLDLGKWAVIVISAVALWHWVLRDLVGKWFQSKLDLQKQDVGLALNIQKDIAIRKAEFEKVKLERVMPLLEEINCIISDHKMMNNSYVSWIVNKAGIPDDFESKRLDLDTKLVKSIASVEIYLPKELRAVIRQIRKIVSCSWKEPLQIYYFLLERGTIESVSDVCNDSNDIYRDLQACFYDMCNKYLGTHEDHESYSSILKRYNFSDGVDPINPNPAQSFLWTYILVHEYVSSIERSEAISGIERAYKAVGQ